MTRPCYRSKLIHVGDIALLILTDLGDPGSPPDPDAIHDILHEWRSRCGGELPVIGLLHDAGGHWHGIQHANGALRAFHPFGAAPAIER
jgi:hypothetical protein